MNDNDLPNAGCGGWKGANIKVIIAGSRDIIDYAIHYVIKAIEQSKFDITEVVSGGARGIDWCGEKWAEANDVPIKRFLPQWNDHGKQAGILRNIQMAEYADALIAIWDGQSRGTRHMIHEAQKRQMPHYVFKVDTTV